MHNLSIIYGTQNCAKLEYMRQLVSDLPIEVNGLSSNLSSIEESGNSPIENAKIKALTYYKILKQPVFSCDSGLYFKDLPEILQPGTYVRRVDGKVLSDEEMINYYSKLAKINGGQLTAYYQNAICLVWNEELIFEYSGEYIASEPFLILDQPHSKVVTGFPLDSLSAEIVSGQYYYDLDSYNYSDSKTASGFCAFFNRVLCKLQRT